MNVIVTTNTQHKTYWSKNRIETVLVVEDNGTEDGGKILAEFREKADCLKACEALQWTVTQNDIDAAPAVVEVTKTAHPGSSHAKFYGYNQDSGLFVAYGQSYPERKLKVKQGFVMFEGEALASFDTTEAAEKMLTEAGYKRDPEEQGRWKWQ